MRETAPLLSLLILLIDTYVFREVITMNKSTIRFLILVAFNILVAVFMVPQYEVGNHVLLGWSLRATAYFAGTAVGVLCAIGFCCCIWDVIKYPSLMGAAESKFDYCAACTNDKLLMERYLSSLGLAIVKWVILALPFLGTVVAYFSAGHVFSGYESLIIALLTVEGMALIAGQLYMMFVSLLYVVRRDERILMPFEYKDFTRYE